ncbi:unnamed protein product [marine sediment metagenome]|uniref:Uncharacterized protein n=1 Tax=marine sediment metagenome TaxID=412755 RepID=X1G9Q2_9ZZZZ
MIESLADFSGIGLAALMVVLGYWVLTNLQKLLAKHYERQELLLQKILIAQLACAEELQEIREALRINDV